MDKYIFLLFSLPYLLIYIIIFIRRKDLRPKLIITGIIGGIGGIISEFVFFQDYWRPPTLMGVGKISIEEFIFGLSVTGITATSFETVFHKKLIPFQKTKLIVITTCYSLAMLFFFAANYFFAINSIFTCSIIFTILALIVLLIRRDLIKQALFSAFFIVSITIINYLVLSVFSPLYWQKYWLLYNTPIGIMIFGKIPWTEILWYSTFGLICGVFYEFALGLKRENVKSNEEIKAVNPFEIIRSEIKKNLK